MIYSGTTGGLFRGRRGAPWESLHQGLMIAPITTLHYGTEGITVGTEGKGAFFNKDSQWLSDNLGLVNLSIRALSGGNSYLYAITNSGLYRRQRVRHRWEALPFPPHVQTGVLSVAVDKDDQVYAGTASGLFLSVNHGKDWKKIEAVGTTPIFAVATYEKSVLAASEGAIWIRLKGEWKKIETDTPMIGLAWRDEKTFLTISNRALFLGEATHPLQPLRTALPAETVITALAVDSRTPGLILLGTHRGLLWHGHHGREDEGENWHPARLYQGERFERQINHMLPINNGMILIATESEGVVLGIARIPKRGLWARWLR